LNREMRRLQAKEEERAKKRRSDSPRQAKKTSKEDKQNLFERALKYFKEVRSELKKVAWPTTEELRTYTIVVFGMTTVLTLLVFGMDWAFNKLVIGVLEWIT
jgi:preprotein translocase subunit SecE